MKYALPLLLLALTACVPTQKSEPAAVVAPAAPATGLVAPAREVVSKGAIPSGTPAIKVAMLLPLSGDSAPVGNAMLDAASLALYDNYLSVPSNQIRSQII